MLDVCKGHMSYLSKCIESEKHRKATVALEADTAALKDCFAMQCVGVG